MGNKKIVITGASRGIGFETAKKFADKGWDVLICARRPEGLAAARDKIPGIFTFTCDLGKRSEVEAFGDYVLETLGTPDVLVNNGGIFLPGSIQDEVEDLLEKLFAVNVASAYHLTRKLLPGMLRRKSGTILNVCSTASIRAYPNGGSYSITKHALLGFSKNLREELKPSSVRVISLIPGATYTSSWEGFDVPKDRLMPPEDIGEIIWNAVNLSPNTVIEEILVRPQLGDL